MAAKAERRSSDSGENFGEAGAVNPADPMTPPSPPNKLLGPPRPLRGSFFLVRTAGAILEFVAENLHVIGGRGLVSNSDRSNAAAVSGFPPH